MSQFEGLVALFIATKGNLFALPVPIHCSTIEGSIKILSRRATLSYFRKDAISCLFQVSGNLFVRCSKFTARSIFDINSSFKIFLILDTNATKRCFRERVFSAVSSKWLHFLYTMAKLPEK